MVDALDMHGAASDRLAPADRVKAWTRERFGLPEDAHIHVSERACSTAGFPPLETSVAFWTDGEARHEFRVYRPAAEVSPDDLPPKWMRDTLVSTEASDCSCC